MAVSCAVLCCRRCCCAQVGYVSPDMFTHSVSYFAEAPLGFHNPARVKLFVYSCVGKPDAKTARLQAKVSLGWAEGCGKAQLYVDSSCRMLPATLNSVCSPAPPCPVQ